MFVHLLFGDKLCWLHEAVCRLSFLFLFDEI